MRAPRKAGKESGSLVTKSLYILKSGLWADDRDAAFGHSGRKDGGKFQREILKG